MGKVLLFVVIAAVLESVGDAVIRVAIHSDTLPSRVGLFLLGTLLLATYGTMLNLAPVDFGTVAGVYAATIFVSFQVTNYLFFEAAPKGSTLVGGAFIVTGATIVYIWR